MRDTSFDKVNTSLIYTYHDVQSNFSFSLFISHTFLFSSIFIDPSLNTPIRYSYHLNAYFCVRSYALFITFQLFTLMNIPRAPISLYTTPHYISVQVEYARVHASIRGCKYLELMALIVRAKLQTQAGKCNEVLAMLQHTK